LPQHGRIECNRCFDDREVIWGRTIREQDGWRLVNNPMAWGGERADILVLGFSKGGNQNADILSRPHDQVAYRGGRKNLAIILETLGLKTPEESIDQLIAERHGRFSFGSLIRCSVKKLSGDKWLMSGKDIMNSCLRDKTMGPVISNCVSQYLGALPASVRLVIMLGNDLTYVDGCHAAISRVRPNLKQINAVSYGDNEVIFTHTIHFKAQGSLVPEWANGTPGMATNPDRDQPLKRQLALEAVTQAMGDDGVF
jgi:hypothetical protein